MTHCRSYLNGVLMNTDLAEPLYAALGRMPTNDELIRYARELHAIEILDGHELRVERQAGSMKPGGELLWTSRWVQS